ncbi:carbohydrate kinase family protein [Candidatus Uhrbacteria bacterium]|jgi:sugar/nucleoside kinase (ribokinase family)|nr:carbohydrate kinase family protein [Candidatus Uhrbacteria bacterium]
MKFDVITIGSAVKDVFVQSDKFYVEESDRFPGSEDACFVLGGKIEIDEPIFGSGGGATNAAATFAKLGLKAATIAKVGSDDTGKEVLKDIHDHGVYTNLMAIAAKGGTGYSVLLTAANGQRTAVVYRGVSKELQPKDIEWSKIQTKWFYVTSLGGNMTLLKKIFSFAAKNDIKIMWNPGSLELAKGTRALKSFFKKTDILSLNREESATITKLGAHDLRNIIKTMSSLVGGVYVLTDGKHGTYASRGEECFFANPTDVKVINATGSGDAFGSAFTTGMIHSDGDIITSLRLGTLNAESVIQVVGAKEGILNRMPGSRRLASIKVEPYRIH